MKQSAGEHGRRVPIRRLRGTWSSLTEPQWLALDKIFNSKLSDTSRIQIDYYCNSFASNAPMYEASNTVLRTKLLLALAQWKNATNQLLHTLKADVPRDADFETFSRAASSYSGESVDTVFPFPSMIPLLQLSSKAASFTTEQLNRTQFTTATDLWDVWVTLVGRTIAEQGLKASARSTADRGKNSAFLEAIKYLQNLLPVVCQTKGKDEAIVKSINTARKRHRKMSTQVLNFHLSILGGQLAIPNPIGSLRDKSETDIKDLEPLYQEQEAVVLGILKFIIANPKLAKEFGIDTSQLENH